LYTKNKLFYLGDILENEKYEENIIILHQI